VVEALAMSVGAARELQPTIQQGHGGTRQQLAGGATPAAGRGGKTPMPLTREDLRASVERAGDEHWRALVAHHEEAYPASRPTPGDVCRAEAERLNAGGYGDAGRWELLETRVTRTTDAVALTHRLRDRQTGTPVDTPPFTNYQ
jgi:hypothetical protein